MKLTILLFTIWSLTVFASPIIGKPASGFTLTGHDGKQYKLSDLKGKTVVLEWYNHGCPFVRKHYDSGNMQALQKEFKNDVVWLTISSSADGRQGHLSSPQVAFEKFKDEKMASQAILLDRSGKVGRAYQAVTTPHMFVINKKGLLAYNGAIDSIPSASPDDVSRARPLARNAIRAVLENRPVPRAQNRPYGCSVKY